MSADPGTAGGTRTAAWMFVSGIVPASRGAMFGALLRHGGEEVKSGAGTLFAAFEVAERAVRFALEAQVLAAGDPSTGGLRVGIHRGEAFAEVDVSGRPDYFGPAVNRASRLASVAHPGQTLLSAATRQAIAGADPGTVFLDLGEHRFRGLDVPERTWQALPAAWPPRAFPPISAVAAAASNLPAQSNEFVGREAEVRQIVEGLASGTRCLALTGSAGVGKSRLAVRAASAVLDRFPGGCAWVDLVDMQSVTEVAEGVLRAFGVPPGSVSAERAVGDLLELRAATLLVLDNVDRIATKAASAAKTWLAQAPAARVLATGRSPFGFEGEAEIRVAPLPLPPAGAAGAVAVRGSDAVRLFEIRAAEARAGFEITDETASDVVAICADLEGLPLAIELAAARIRILSPADILKKMGQKFQLLRGAPKDTHRRNQALQSTLDWSYDQLGEEEREVFGQLSVFRGGFFAEATAEVLGSPAAAEVVRSLVRRSLVNAPMTPLGERFTIYRPMREYAERRWVERSTPESRAAVKARHARYYGDETRRWGDRLMGPDEFRARDRIAADLENVLEAIDAALDPEMAALGVGPETSAAALNSLSMIAERSMLIPSYRERLERSLAALETLPDSPGRSSNRVRLRTLLASWLRSQRETPAAVPLHELAVEEARRLAEPRTLIAALHGQGVCFWVIGRFEEALANFNQVLDLARADELWAEAAMAANGVAMVCSWQDRNEESLRWNEEALALFDRAGYEYGRCMVRSNRGVPLKALGRDEESKRCYERAIREARESKYTSLLGVVYSNYGGTLSDLGQWDEAHRYFRESEECYRAVGDRTHVASTIANIGVLELRQGKYPEALKSFEEAIPHMEANGDLSAIALNTRNLASTLDCLGRLEEGLALYRDSGQMSARLGVLPDVAASDAAASRVLYRLGRWEEARSAALAALKEIEDRVEATEERFTAHGVLALCDERDGNTDSAREHARKSLRCADFEAHPQYSAQLLTGKFPMALLREDVRALAKRLD